jgi:hypothetical protein
MIPVFEYSLEDIRDKSQFKTMDFKKVKEIKGGMEDKKGGKT